MFKITAEQFRATLRIVMLISATLLVATKIIAYVWPYEYFASNDSYRDYGSVEYYLLAGEPIPSSISYYDRPLLHYTLMYWHLSTSLPTLDLIRAWLPVLWGCLAFLGFYIVFRRWSLPDTLALLVALLLTLGDQWFNEMVGIRPNFFILMLVPFILFWFTLLQTERWRWLIFFHLIGLLLIGHTIHPYGTMLVVITLLSLGWAQRRALKQYWFLLLAALVILLLFNFLFPASLLARTVAFVFTIITGQNVGLASNILSFNVITTTIGVWLSMTVVAGLGALMVLLVRRWPTVQTNYVFIILSLFGFGLFMTWLGPKLGINVIPQRMIVYTWLGAGCIISYFILTCFYYRWLAVPVGIILLSGLSVLRPPYDALDHAYILGQDVAVAQYLDTHASQDPIILIQASNGAIFTLTNMPKATLLNNWGNFGRWDNEKDKKLFSKVFYAPKAADAHEAVKKMLNKYNLSTDREVYIVYSLTKNRNTYLWQGADWFRAQSLDGANLKNFNDPAYFTEVFNNGDTIAWRWQPAKPHN